MVFVLRGTNIIGYLRTGMVIRNLHRAKGHRTKEKELDARSTKELANFGRQQIRCGSQQLVPRDKSCHSESVAAEANRFVLKAYWVFCCQNGPVGSCRYGFA